MKSSRTSITDYVTGRVFILSDANQFWTVMAGYCKPEVMRIDPNLHVGDIIPIHKLSITGGYSTEEFKIIRVENTDNTDDAQVDYCIVPA